LDDATIHTLIQRLEFRGQDHTFSGWLDGYLEHVELPAVAQVLVLGCGTAEGTFNAVIARTLLSDVEDPLALLQEAARVANLMKKSGDLGIRDEKIP
jgi:hypothetical protein